MIKQVVSIGAVSMLFSGCTLFQPNLGVTKKEVEVSKMDREPPPVVPSPVLKERRVTLPPQTTPYIKTPPPKRVLVQKEPSDLEVIANVFTEETPDSFSSQRLIGYLEMFPWEKRALKNAYGKHGKLWTQREIHDFLAIINEDKYLSLCGEKRYLDNLMFTSNPAKQDLLYSVLLLKYLNNLSHGCVEWVSSDGAILNENREEYIESDYLLSMLPKDILIERLFTRYIPKEEDFFPALKRYKLLTKYLEKSDEIKSERLQIEVYKSAENHPNYE